MNEHDYEIVDWCTDTISGAKDNRPELNKILYQSDVLPRHEAVIVFKNDRVARDTKLYFYYFYTLEKRNVKLLSTEEHFSEGDDFANIYRSWIYVIYCMKKGIELERVRGFNLLRYEEYWLIVLFMRANINTEMWTGCRVCTRLFSHWR